nr:hypothetical protein [Tanacetum cinerariifolium]
MESQSETIQTVSALKLLVLKTREYDLWSKRMEQYLTFTYHALWEVIVNGDSVSPVGTEGHVPPKTAKQKLARKNELKEKITLMLASPDEYLLKFNAYKDTKPLWKQSRIGLDKTYDTFKKLISQLEIHGEVISQEDVNLKLLRSLPPAWNNIALIMRNRSDLDTLSIDDLYNNLKLDNKDLEQLDTNDLKEMDLKWQVAMLTMRVKRFIKNIGRKLDLNRKETVRFDRTKVKCYNCLGKAEEELTNFDLMAYTFQGSSSLDSEDDNQVNDRFKKGKGHHVVPSPYNRNYMPPRADLSFAGLDNSAFKSKGNPQYALHDQGIFDSGCSRYVTGNKSYLTDYQEIDGGFVAFGGNAKGDLFNDPRIIMEQRIDAYKGYRGGGVEVMCRGYKIRCGGLGSRFDMLDGVGRCHGCFGLKWSHVLSLLAKEVLEQ